MCILYVESTTNVLARQDSYEVQLDLAKHVKTGCKEEDLVGLIFNTIGVRCVSN
jgi:hypothetical protein